MDIGVLIEQLKTKDEHGIALLYDHYSAPLYGYILRLVKKEHVAELILQQTFLTIINEIHTQKEDLHLFTRMVAIARPLIKNSIDHDFSKEYHTAEAMDEKTLWLEQMEGMSLLQKKVFDYLYLKNRTLLETSLILNLPVTEVRILLRTALKHISSH